MDPQNPYAPPVEPTDEHPRLLSPEGGTLSLSGEGWETVGSMAKWMRIVAGLQYAGAALVAIGALIVGKQLASLGGQGGRFTAIFVFTTVMLVAYAVLLFLGATWLRGAARGFYEGVLADHESPLADGFRKLRLYLILYGIFSVIGLLGQMVKLGLMR